MPKKKVLVWETLATVSGGQKMTLLVMELLKEECDFFCLIPGKGKLSDELDKRNIPYAFMGDQSLPTGVKGKRAIIRYGWLSLKNIVRSLIKIAVFKPDILYAPGPAALPWSAVCGMLTGKKVIWHLHHVFIDGPTKKLLNICAGWKTVRNIISVSHYVGDQIVNSAACDKVDVMYNPIDVVKYSSGNPSVIRQLINRMGAVVGQVEGPSRIVIGHVGLVQESKCQDFVLDVIATLRGRGYNAIGLFPGEIRDCVYLEKLKKQASCLNLDKHVMFLGRRDDIPDILKVLNVLIVPSVEGLSLAGLEAAAAGVPVVAADVAGAAELVKASGIGLTFKAHSVEAACAAVIDAWGNAEQYRANAEAYMEKCSDQTYASKLKQIFE